MTSRETLYTIALTRIKYFNLASIAELYRTFGSATAVMENRNNLRDAYSEVPKRLEEALKNMDEALHRAEVELSFNSKHGIKTLCMNDPSYPQRMRECNDAPLVLFYKGNADINKSRVVSIVGTRHCTSYGQDLVRRFTADLNLLCPETLVISGLAYGIDITAHREALRNNLDTIAVLAHGLDTIYPAHHRKTAIEMLQQGGLMTEFLTGTYADKMNFVRRNRIIAGLSDACIVVESGSKGGSLITAGIAHSYDRDTFAFPGMTTMPYSEGCNQLIRDNKASLITSAEDFVNAMGWYDEKRIEEAKRKGLERQLFPNLTPEEQLIVDILRQSNDMQMNLLAVKSNLPVQKLSPLLFALEMKGVVKPIVGGSFHLLL